MNEIIERAEILVKEFLETDGTGHDWFHIERVWNNAKRIASSYPEANINMVSLIAILHDLGDYKLHNGNHKAGEQYLAKALDKLGLLQDQKNSITKAISEVSFKGAGVKNKVSSIEAAIVQDADRLDALGAIGIARAFAYGGSKQRLMHNPNEKPEFHDSFEAYSTSEGTTINHFYEKLLLLKDQMNTKIGREIALERHQFMNDYLKQFYVEWNAEG